MYLRITYDGPGLDTHEIDAQDLIPSLLALADLFDEASRVIFNDPVKSRVKVRASFLTGSFRIELSVNTLAQILNRFSNTESIITTLVEDGVYGLIAILRKMAGRSVLRVEHLNQGSALALVLEDGSQWPVKQTVLQLLESPPVIEQLGKVLEPLQWDGMIRVAFGDDESFKEIVEKEELPFFTPTSVQEIPLIHERSTMVFSPVSVSFDQHHPWRMSDGQNTLEVFMKDPTFLQKVTDGEPFAKSDLLICEVTIRQWQTATKLRTEYAIVKVLEHRVPAIHTANVFLHESSPGLAAGACEPRLLD